jgi:hypothetical protein
MTNNIINPASVMRLLSNPKGQGLEAFGLLNTWRCQEGDASEQVISGIINCKYKAFP